MARAARYFVVVHEGQWKISLDGQYHGPYSTQATAIRAAVDAAHGSCKMGINAQVLVQDQDFRFRTEWAYGNDPYPPPG